LISSPESERFETEKKNKRGQKYGEKPSKTDYGKAGSRKARFNFLEKKNEFFPIWGGDSLGRATGNLWGGRAPNQRRKKKNF